MPNTSTQSYSHDQNEQRRKSRLQAARSTDTAKASNDAFQDQKVVPIQQPQKKTIKQPQEITSPEHARSRAQDLKLEQRATNDSTPLKELQQNTATKQPKTELKHRQKIAQNLRRKLSMYSPKKQRAKKKYQRIIKRYEKSPFILLYSLAVTIAILDLLSTGFSFALYILGTTASWIPILGTLIESVAGLTSMISSIFLGIISLMMSLYIAIFVWTHTDFITRKIIYITLIMIIDLIPVINLIPITLIVVFLVQNTMKKEVEDAENKLKRLEKL